MVVGGDGGGGADGGADGGFGALGDVTRLPPPPPTTLRSTL